LNDDIASEAYMVDQAAFKVLGKRNKMLTVHSNLSMNFTKLLKDKKQSVALTYFPFAVVVQNQDFKVSSFAEGKRRCMTFFCAPRSMMTMGANDKWSMRLMWVVPAFIVEQVTKYFEKPVYIDKASELRGLKCKAILSG
jgi:hypothetical protein